MFERLRSLVRTFRKRTDARWAREMRLPTRFGILVNPFYFARRGLRVHVAELARALQGRLLDVGCGTKPYAAILPVREHVGLELEGRKRRMADVTYDGRTFPFGSGEFDAVFTSQVLEHVFDPDRFLGEIHRVLKTDGLLLLTVPFIWEEHEAPYDRQRYTSFGLRHVLSRAGFAVVQQRKSAPGLRALAQLVASYVYAKTLAGRDYCLRRLGAIVLIAPINLLGALLCRVLPGHDALYLDNVVLARKQAPDRD